MNENLPILVSMYLGLFIGAPAVFFYFVTKQKQKDVNEVASHVEDLVRRERRDEEAGDRAYLKKLEEKVNALEALALEKDAALKEMNAEFERIKPLMKYLRTPPSSEE